MVITELSPVGKGKKRLVIDEESLGYLYYGDIHRMHLEEGMEGSLALRDEIMEKLYLRAKERALYLVSKNRKTQGQLVLKLKEGGYHSSTIAKVLNFMKEYGFIDDRQYILDFYEYKKDRYSSYQIKKKLLEKRIDKNLIAQVLEEQKKNDSYVLQGLIEKFSRGKDLKDSKEKRRIISKLAYRGFSYGDISQALGKVVELKTGAQSPSSTK